MWSFSFLVSASNQNVAMDSPLIPIISSWKLVMFSPILNIVFFQLLLVLSSVGKTPFYFIHPLNLHCSIRNKELGWTTNELKYRSFRAGVRS